MPHTLRRKMFKLGGEVNTHGVGITSGLNYNRPGYKGGGEVQATYGVGNNANKTIGPDGKVREAHSFFNPANWFKVANILGGGIPKTSKWWSKIINPKTRKDVLEYGMDSADEVAKARAAARAAWMAGGLDEASGLAKILASKGINPLSKWGKARMYAGRVAGPAAFTGSLASGLFPDTPFAEDDTLGERIGKGARKGLEIAGGFTGPGLALDVYGNIIPNLATPYEDVDIGLYPAEIMRNMLGMSKDKDKDELEGPGPSNVPITPPMETALTQEEEFEKLRADAAARANMYYNMLSEGGPDKVRALSDAFTQAGATWDEDKPTALAAFKSGIDAELDREAAIKDEARRLGLGDVISLSEEERQAGKAEQQMIDQAKLAIISSPDLMPEARAQGLKQIEAWEAGVTDVLPLNAKQDGVDPNRVSRGSVYLDLTSLYGGMYVGVSSDDKDPEQIKGFNSVEEARAHARG